MARARNIKPGFFRNADLVELPAETRLLFIGLWTLADREGRIEDRPKQIKMELFPADSFDVGSMLDQLKLAGFVGRYEVDSIKVLEVVNFIKHQDPHYKEKASELPPRPGSENFMRASGVTRLQRQRILERDGNACLQCAATDALCIDHIVPVSRGGDSSDENLQVLCSACNTKKGNKLDGESKNSKQRRINIDPTSSQINAASPSESLIPDSLNPESRSLIPDPLTEPNGSVARADQNPSPQSVVDLFHEVLPELPKVRILDDKRKRSISNFCKWVLTSKRTDGVRRAQTTNEAVDWIRSYFDRARDNDFLMGRGTKAPGHERWECDIDFLLSDKGKKFVIEKTREAA